MLSPQFPNKLERGVAITIVKPTDARNMLVELVRVKDDKEIAVARDVSSSEPIVMPIPAVGHKFALRYPAGSYDLKVQTWYPDGSPVWSMRFTAHYELE